MQESSTQGFGRGSVPVSITDVNCRGTESNLAECSYSTNRQSNCEQYSGHIIGVQCKSGKNIGNIIKELMHAC